MSYEDLYPAHPPQHGTVQVLTEDLFRGRDCFGKYGITLLEVIDERTLYNLNARF